MDNLYVDTDQLLPRVLLSGIRDSDSSPEWSTFKAMTARVGERYNDHTLLNKMIGGWTAFKMHWIAMQDVKADPLMVRIEKELGISSAKDTELEWQRFDIKPVGSRAPQLPECFERLHSITKRMGAIDQ